MSITEITFNMFSWCHWNKSSLAQA